MKLGLLKDIILC